MTEQMIDEFFSFIRRSGQRLLWLLTACFIVCGILIGGASTAFGQREYTVIRPRERAVNESVTASKRASQATKGVLVVVLDPVISGKVSVFDSKGRLLDEADADAKNGRVEFELKRGHSYLVQASSPGYISVEGKSELLKSSSTMRLKLKAQFAKVELPGLPAGAQIFIDDKQRAIVDQRGAVVLDNLEPGSHSLLVRHPEYNDYRVDLGNLEAGVEISFFPLKTILVKVAKLTIAGPGGATILIDGAVYGRIGSDGKVEFDYRLEQATEHTISVELVGYHTLTRREMLAPGPRTITVKLDPMTTSAGVSDFFDNLSLWNAPSSWKIVSEGRNKKLEVKGPQLGSLSNKTYRDFTANFTIWLDDGKGATWAVRTDRESRNYYLFHLAGPKSTTQTPNRFYTYLVRDGGDPIEVSTPIPVIIDLTQPGSYTITVTVRDYTIRHSIVGNQKIEESDLGIWTDTTETKDKFLFGTFGFRSLFGEVFTVDDLNLEPIKE